MEKCHAANVKQTKVTSHKSFCEYADTFKNVPRAISRVSLPACIVDSHTHTRAHMRLSTYVNSLEQIKDLGIQILQLLLSFQAVAEELLLHSLGAAAPLGGRTRKSILRASLASPRIDGLK